MPYSRKEKNATLKLVITFRLVMVLSGSLQRPTLPYCISCLGTESDGAVLNSASDLIHPSLAWYSPTGGGRGGDTVIPLCTHCCYGGEDARWDLKSQNIWVVDKQGRPFLHCQLHKVLLARTAGLFTVAEKCWINPERQLRRNKTLFNSPPRKP